MNLPKRFSNHEFPMKRGVYSVRLTIFLRKMLTQNNLLQTYEIMYKDFILYENLTSDNG